MNQNTTLPNSTTSQADIEVHLDLVVGVNLDGVPPEVIKDLVALGARRFLSEGMVTGHTEACVQEHRASVMALTQREVNLTPDEIVAFFSAEVRKEALPQEQLIARLVDLALKHPAEVRKELAKMIEDEKEFA